MFNLSLLLLAILLIENKQIFLIAALFLSTLYFDILNNFNILIIVPIIIYLLLVAAKTQIYILTLIFYIGSLWIVNYNNFNLIWIGIEIQSFSLISLLFMHNKYNLTSIESIFKYFTIMCITSSFFILFIIIVNFSEVNHFMLMNYSLINKEIILLLLILPMIFKLGLFPFHIWINDVYLGINMISIYLISIIPKLTTILILIRVPTINNLMILVALATIILGSLYGINQSSIKLLIAFSGIVNLSLIVLSISATHETFSIPIVYTVSYLLSFIGLMMGLIYLKGIYLHDIIGIYSYKKFIAFCSMVSILSMLGFPPLIGFLAKFMLLKGLIINDDIAICFVVIACSFISTFFYLRMINLQFNFENQKLKIWKNITAYAKSESLQVELIFLIIFFILLACLLIQFIFKLTTCAVINLI